MACGAGVAVAMSPTGPFTFIRSFRPNGQQSRDLAVFKVPASGLPYRQLLWEVFEGIAAPYDVFGKG